ncbi:MAG TPA: flagellar hook-length control protein FliK [Candidatus Defluviicoccus seviourii]|nr:flagellar hook-length control protein FliK [Candidatus Defluviicoccus seviourii]
MKRIGWFTTGRGPGSLGLFSTARSKIRNGEIDAEISIRDGRVSALVLTENREALDALKAETRALQQALQDAGLKADADSLSFQMQGEHGRRSTGQMFVPEGADVRSSSNRAEEGALKDTLRSAEPHRPVNPRGQLDVVA